MVDDQKKELHLRAANWYEENQPANFTILALHTERSHQRQKNAHYMVLAAEDALSRCAPSQACFFLNRSLTVLTDLKKEFVSVKTADARKKNQVDIELSMEEAVMEKNPRPDDTKWLSAMEKYVIGRLSKANSLVSQSRILLLVLFLNLFIYFVFLFSFLAG
jgi:hypothetical protein